VSQRRGERPAPLTYREAGVDIEAGNALVERIRPAVARTARPGVVGGIGGFGGLFALEPGRWREPVLVAGTDGVGTKLRLAIAAGRHRGVGVDLVAMCANDVAVQGAEPLFFLDYYATGRLDVDVAAEVVEGVAEGCVQAGCALLGGETAEMPGMYAPGDYDLAGFCVGVVERERLVDGRGCAPGDVLVGLASSGPHSNGYSLIRRILEHTGADLAQALDDGTPLGEALLAPTRIYVRALLALHGAGLLKAAAHITGGGLPENLPRVLPEGVRAVVDADAWPEPPVFAWLRAHGPVARAEMYRTFNCGVGMVVVVPAAEAERALALAREAGETAWAIGRLEPAVPGTPRIEIRGGPA